MLYFIKHISNCNIINIVVVLSNISLLIHKPCPHITSATYPYSIHDCSELCLDAKATATEDRISGSVL